MSILKGYKEVRVNIEPTLWEFLLKIKGDRSAVTKLCSILEEYKQNYENPDEVNNDKRTQTRSIL